MYPFEFRGFKVLKLNSKHCCIAVFMAVLTINEDSSVFSLCYSYHISEGHQEAVLIRKQCLQVCQWYLTWACVKVGITVLHASKRAALQTAYWHRNKYSRRRSAAFGVMIRSERVQRGSPWTLPIPGRSLALHTVSQGCQE